MASTNTEQRRANIKLGLTLALIALVFGLGFVARQVWFGG